MDHEDRSYTCDEIRRRLADGGGARSDLDAFDTVMSRRRFFGLTGRGGAVLALAGLGAGADSAVTGLFCRGMIPVAWAQEASSASQVPGKPGMIVHVSRPIAGEFPPHLLDDDVTPTERHFVRNNSAVPQRAEDRDPKGWKLKIDGEVNRTLELSLDDLKKMPSVSLPLLIECGGDGRSLFEPHVRGTPWGRGGVACSKWTGVRLKDVLERAGLKASAKYTAHYGEDVPIGLTQPFSRGVPIDKAMEPHTLVAYEMNGQPLDPLNGFPVRLVVPGWIGSCSQKWLTRIWIRDRVHDSEKMSGYSYRVPANPVEPGSRPPESDMVIATSWIIKSLITRPAADASVAVDKKLSVAGHAWAGERKVAKVLISTDYGVEWTKTRLTDPPNPYAWYRWETDVSFPRKGYYEIWARASDDRGSAQPFRQPWNPKGYLSNVIHRLPVHVKA